ncbi:MAG: hypothetical protein NZO16_05970 [Deltaproteobacteria bacterium]|nr:hypothetical protein [Deltaproteobacteria bacterium]
MRIAFIGLSCVDLDFFENMEKWQIEVFSSGNLEEFVDISFLDPSKFDVCVVFEDCDAFEQNPKFLATTQNNFEFDLFTPSTEQISKFMKLFSVGELHSFYVEKGCNIEASFTVHFFSAASFGQYVVEEFLNQTSKVLSGIGTEINSYQLAFNIVAGDLSFLPCSNLKRTSPKSDRKWFDIFIPCLNGQLAITIGKKKVSATSDSGFVELLKGEVFSLIDSNISAYPSILKRVALGDMYELILSVVDPVAMYTSYIKKYLDRVCESISC